MPKLEKIENKTSMDYIPGMEKLPDDPDGLLAELNTLESKITPEQKRTRENLKILARYLKDDETWVRKNTVKHIHSIIRNINTMPAQTDESIDRQFTDVFNEFDINKALKTHLKPNLDIIEKHYSDFEKQVKNNIENPADQEKMLQNVKLIKQKINELLVILSDSDYDLAQANEVIDRVGNLSMACGGWFKRISDGKCTENTINAFNATSNELIVYLDNILTNPNFLKEQLSKH